MNQDTNMSRPVDPFSSFSIGNIILKNRFMRSATFDGSADDQGMVTDMSVDLFRRLGQANIGLIVTGHAFVEEAGQAGPGQYGIHNDRTIPGLRRLVEAVHAGGGKIAVQISHAGINTGYLQGKGITALAVSVDTNREQAHREMTAADIERVLEAFGTAAGRAVMAGFDAVQLHAAHGYLLSQFLSPLTNKRQDEWGGTAEKRRRFHLEVVKRVRNATQDRIPLLIKFGVKDDVAGGLIIDEGLETARQMVTAGVAVIEVSGGLGATSVVKGIAYFRERAAAVKRAVTVPVAAVGGIRSLDIVISILNSGDADLISMSRPFIREINLLNNWQKGNGLPAACISCSRCLVTARRGTSLNCAQDSRPKLTT
jgi:2,4-dienoyl-CoA reductase-like NADH-dependent reductase (Old Yellow Enzyme family)